MHVGNKQQTRLRAAKPAAVFWGACRLSPRAVFLSPVPCGQLPLSLESTWWRAGQVVGSPPGGDAGRAGALWRQRRGQQRCQPPTPRPGGPPTRSALTDQLETVLQLQGLLGLFKKDRSDHLKTKVRQVDRGQGPLSSKHSKFHSFFQQMFTDHQALHQHSGQNRAVAPTSRETDTWMRAQGDSHRRGQGPRGQWRAWRHVSCTALRGAAPDILAPDLSRDTPVSRKTWGLHQRNCSWAKRQRGDRSLLPDKSPSPLAPFPFFPVAET